MKKLLLFIDCLGAGGAQRQLVGLAIMLQEKGYIVKVCTYFDIDFYKRQLDDAGVSNELIPEADNTKKRIIAVRKYFKRENPDWVIAYQETPSLVACAAKLLGCKYKLIVSERNTTQKVGMNERVRFFLYHWADAIVPNSYTQEQYLEARHPWMKKKLRTISNFVDMNLFTPSVEKNQNERVEIVIAASIWASKNTLGFIEALRLLSQRTQNYHVRWFGKSELNIDYFIKAQKLINEYGLNDNIELLEKTSEIVNKYRESDFFCLPSFYEGTPNVICEAMSCGLPIICSDVCDNGIYVVEGKNGWLFDPMNSQEIADKLYEAITASQELRANYSKNSRLIAESKLSKKTFAEKYISLINK